MRTPLTSPSIPSSTLLRSSLYTLLEATSADISWHNESHFLSDPQLSSAAYGLLTFLAYWSSRNNTRRAVGPIDAENLVLRNMRTRNADEERKEEGKVVRGEKEWYKLVLFEVQVGGNGGVQTVIEGGLVKEKKDLMHAFLATITTTITKWEELERECLEKAKNAPMLPFTPGKQRMHTRKLPSRVNGNGKQVLAQKRWEDMTERERAIAKEEQIARDEIAKLETPRARRKK